METEVQTPAAIPMIVGLMDISRVLKESYHRNLLLDRHRQLSC
ncbi:MAG: hypothetical protein K0Q95_1181 [Bacteroidota bacterium]|jgi:hypothetical protein|nr:hypothetical protein [Bacteroidota bacterium]